MQNIRNNININSALKKTFTPGYLSSRIFHTVMLRPVGARNLPIDGKRGDVVKLATTDSKRNPGNLMDRSNPTAEISFLENNPPSTDSISHDTLKEDSLSWGRRTVRTVIPEPKLKQRRYRRDKKGVIQHPNLPHNAVAELMKSWSRRRTDNNQCNSQMDQEGLQSSQRPEGKGEMISRVESTVI